MKLTPWFKARVKPARPGVYEIRFPDDVFSNDSPAYALWDGERWGWASATAKFAAANGAGCMSGATQKKEWRGLAEEPKQ